MTTLDVKQKKAPPPPPPPPPKIEAKAADAKRPGGPAAKPDGVTKRLEQENRERMVDMRGVPPPGTGPNNRGADIRKRLEAAGVDMNANRPKSKGRTVTDPTLPFSGSGATGKDVKSGEIPAGDYVSLGVNRVIEKGSEPLIGGADAMYETGYNIENNAFDKSFDLEQNAAELAKRMTDAGYPVAGSYAGYLGSQGAELMRNAGTAVRSGFEAVGTGLEQTHNGLATIGEDTRLRYSNPVDDSDDYVSKLRPEERKAQAATLLQQPINTLYPDAYGGKPPTRAQVVEAAAKKHNLDPNVLGGFLLAEQRDQSRNEDMKDYTGARLGANLSVGLGQMTVDTARRNGGEMFADTLDARSRQRLTRADAAKLLTSDEHAIFASARYLRKIADEGAATPASKLANTRAAYPNLNQPGLRGRNWNDDQIRALGSEYTSRAWDDKLVETWGRFVLAGSRDVRATGIFP